MDAPFDLTQFQSALQTTRFGRHFEYRETLGSTQDLARELAEGDAPEGTVVVAEEQTAGRGRLGRGWESPALQNLYLTLIVRPPAAALRSLGMLTPLAVAEAIEAETGLSAVIKWPNDMLVGGRKLAGVLIDSRLAGQDAVYALVGIGINVNMEPARYPQIAGLATSLRAELGQDVPRERLLATLLGRLEPLYEAQLSGASPYDAWRARLDTLGRRIRVRHGEVIESGMAEDVNTDGALLLRRDDGTLAVLDAGEVTLEVS